MMRFRKFQVLTVFGAMLALGCTATTAAGQNTETYVIDNNHTHITWRVDRFGFANTVGSFADVSGTLELNETDPEKSSVSVTISLEGLRSDLKQREDIVRGEYWLDANAFPTITFSSHSVALVESDTSGQTADISGTLTVKGKSAPASFTASLNKIGTDPVTKRKAVGFSATGSLSRADFGVTTALGPVGERVAFDIELLAVQSEMAEPE